MDTSVKRRINNANEIVADLFGQKQEIERETRLNPALG